MEKGESSQDRAVTYCIQRVSRGKRKGDPYVLKGREVVLGRHLKADIQVDSDQVSRKHAVLTRSGSTWSLLDYKETQERLRSLTNRLESALQEKEEVERQLQAQQEKFKASQKQEKELNHLAKNLKGQLKWQKREERKLQKQLQARQKKYDKSIKQEKKLESQLKQRKKCEEELVKKLQAQRKRFQERLTRQKNLQQEQEKKAATGRKRKKQTQDTPKDDLDEPSTSNGHTKNLKKREKLPARENEAETTQNFQDIVQTQLNCSICSELFIQAHTLGCSHTFCKYCITLWRRKKNECPICRTPIKSMVHALVVDNFIDQVVGNMSPQVRDHRLELSKERMPSASTVSTSTSTHTSTSTSTDDMYLGGYTSNSESNSSGRFENLRLYSSFEESDGSSTENTSHDESGSSDEDSSSEDSVSSMEEDSSSSSSNSSSSSSNNNSHSSEDENDTPARNYLYSSSFTDDGSSD